MVSWSLNKRLKKILIDSRAAAVLPHQVLVRNNYSHLSQKLCITPSWRKQQQKHPHSHSESCFLLPSRSGFLEVLRNILHQLQSWLCTERPCLCQGGNQNIHLREFFSPVAAGVAGPCFAISSECSLVYTLSSLEFQTLCKTAFSCWDSHAKKELHCYFTTFLDFSVRHF